MSGALAGVRVLVTRPAHQADELCRLIEAEGGEALRAPALDIVPVAGDGEDLADADLAVFVSVNAVSHGAALLPPAGDEGPRIAAIGPATAAALEDAGHRATIVPEDGYDSEALLNHPALQHPEGWRVVIVRGEGGRELLADTLRERGAETRHLEVYRRERPAQLDPDATRRLALGEVDVATANSVATLDSLWELTGDEAREALRRTPVVTASARVVEKVAALGFEHPALKASGPGDAELVAAIRAWREDPSAVAMDTRSRNADTDPADDEAVAAGEEPAGEEPAGDGMPAAAGAANPPGEDPEAPVVEEARPGPSGDVGEASPSVAAQPPPASGERGGPKLSAIALLLALLSLLGTALLWWQEQQRPDATAALRAELEADLSGNRDAVEAGRRELAGLRGQVEAGADELQQATAATGELAARVDDQQRTIESVAARIRATEEAIDVVRGVSAAARESWVRAEAEYFLQTANARLQLAQDPQAALAALLAADDRLTTLADPSLTAVRRQVAREVQALRAVPRPDIEGITHTLSGLAARIDELPLMESRPERFDVGGEPEVEGDTALERARSTLWGVVNDMVSIKRTDAQITPLLAPSEQYFLARNLELQLQTARLAAMRGDPANYTESLSTALDWLQAHFDPGDPGVQSAAETLQSLATRDIDPELPDISESLRLLRQANAAGAAG